MKTALFFLKTAFPVNIWISIPFSLKWLDFWASPKTAMYRRKKTLCVTKSISLHLREIRTAMVHNISGRMRNRGTSSQSGMFLYII